MKVVYSACWTPMHPNNHVLCDRNLYKSQKLLSLSLEGDMPVWDMGVANMFHREDISMPDYLSEEELDTLPALLLVALLVFVLCVVYRLARCRTRPRRKRQTRLRRFMTSIRMPAV